jgi:hypothetical protein
MSIMPLRSTQRRKKFSEMGPTILIVGHSHVECLSAAARTSGRDNIDVINIQTLPNFRTASPEAITTMVVEAARHKDPDALCLCLFGNVHNIVGIIEDPQPFSIGDAEAGAIPANSEGRWFIPYSVALDSFTEWFGEAPKLNKALYSAFPRARNLYVVAPPPISDWPHILAHPDVFKDKLHLGPAPDALRLTLYRLQCQVLQEAAEDCGADIIAVDPHAVDTRGFLKQGFYGNDPTHGNLHYGTLMLTCILQNVRKAP